MKSAAERGRIDLDKRVCVLISGQSVSVLVRISVTADEYTYRAQ